MRYISTRGTAPALAFRDALLAGLASDGGLYVPESLPEFSPAEIAQIASLSYPTLAQRILQPFVEGTFDDATLKRLCETAYQNFRHKAVAPLTQIAPQHFILELFHGPTLAFKDFALQLVGLMMEEVLASDNAPSIVLGATSGDTGSAAIAGLRGKRNLKIVILYPDGRPSEVQRRQMTTTGDANVHALAVKGTFDDCQDMVKALFADAEFRARHRLLAVNSINIARVLAQIVYYFYAALALGAPAKAPVFCVPTGNFGDVYAGYLAKQMGLPISGLLVATNANDILARCIASGEYRMARVEETLSPSMDIQIASNFERLLFDLFHHDGAALKHAMHDLRRDGVLSLTPEQHSLLRRDFSACSVSDADTRETILRTVRSSGYLLDPHTAVGVQSAEHYMAAHSNSASPMITLATAHAAKFPEVVKEVTGKHPALPEGADGFMRAPETIIPLHNTTEALHAFLETL